MQKKSIILKITSVMTVLLFLCFMVWIGLREQTPGRVYYGEGKEWQDWTDYLFFTTQNQDYAYAFAWVDDVSADFTWGFYDDRESLVEDFLEKKEDMIQKEKDAVLWCFVKLRLDEDIYGADIYEYLKQNLSEEDYEYRGVTFPYEVEKKPDRETPYHIEQIQIEDHLEEENPYRCIWKKREAVIYDGYLYLLAYEDITEENKRTMTSQIENFLDWFMSGHYGYAYFLETEEFEYIKQAALQAKREENNIHPVEEETDTDAQEMPYTLTITVEDGDSLWKISEEYYGDGRRWEEIYENNRITIGDNPSLIMPGMEFALP